MCWICARSAESDFQIEAILAIEVPRGAIERDEGRYSGRQALLEIRGFFSGPHDSGAAAYDKDGLIGSDFRSWNAMEKTVMEICRGRDRETIAASIQAVTEQLTCGSVGYWLKRTAARRLALAGGLFSNVRLNRLLVETLPLDEIFIFPAMGDDGLAVGAALCFLRQCDGLDAWLRQRCRLETMFISVATTATGSMPV